MTTHDNAIYRPSMADVAKHAGVSHQTVSRVLNDYPGVRKKTRDKVIEAIEALGYRRNAAARSLVTQRSGLLGVAAIGSFLYGPTSTIAALEKAARESNFTTLLATVSVTDTNQMDKILGEFLDRSVEAIVIIAAREALLRYVAEVKFDIPVIVVGPSPSNSDGMISINVEQGLGAEIAIEHLLDLGHRKLGVLAGPRDWIDAQQRFAAAMSTCYKHNVSPIVYEGDWSASSGYTIAKKILSTPEHERPSAVFSANDEMALGMLACFNSQGIDVPNDISVIGFDDVPASQFYSPSLTTIHQDFPALGRKAVDIALSLIAGENLQIKAVRPSLVVRDSTSRLGR